MAPTAISPPYFSSEELKHMEITLSLACMINVAEPRATQGNTSAGAMRIFSFFSRSMVLGPVRNRSTQTQERHWEIMVARAAPRTPIFSAKINSGSSTILATAPISTVRIPIWAKPCAVMKAFMPSVNCTNTVPMA